MFRRLTRALTVTGIIAVLTACESSPPQPADDPGRYVTQPTAPAPAQPDPRPEPKYGDRDPTWRYQNNQLEAARGALREGQVDRATEILATLASTDLAPDLAPELQLQVAELDLINGNAKAALQRLATLPAATGGARSGLLRAAAWDQLEDPRRALAARASVDEQLTPAERQVNHQDIWWNLSQIPRWELDALRDTTEGRLRGWIELASLVRQGTTPAQTQRAALQTWVERWGDHPGRQFLPPQAAARNLESVAAILPLSGPLGPAGRAVRDGLMAAWLETQAQVTRGLPTRLTFLDSNRASPQELLRRAEFEGAELIIGPLQRQLVEQFVQAAPPTLPIIALNRLPTHDEATMHPRLLQLSLRAEDETAAIIDRLRKEQHQRLLLVVSAAPWAERIANDFEDDWLTTGGTVVERVSLTRVSEANDILSAALAIEDSNQRSAGITARLSEQAEFLPAHRDDVDAVLLIATAVHARVTATTLAYHYADDLPVFATSHAHAPGRHPELDGIRFCDVPWNVVATPVSDAVRDRLGAARGRQSALYALGADAWFLQERLMNLAPASKLLGHTGRLTTDAHGILQRELIWARFENGEAVPDSPTSGP